MPAPSPITAQELKQALDAGAPVRLLDVREPHEFVSELGHIAGSQLIPLKTLPQEAAKLAGDQRELVLICKSGGRAGQAAEFLAQKGHKTRVLVGGMLAWNDAKLPISRDPS